MTVVVSPSCPGHRHSLHEPQRIGPVSSTADDGHRIAIAAAVVGGVRNREWDCELDLVDDGHAEDGGDERDRLLVRAAHSWS